ncbi:hypothetical protein ABV409_15125 [Flagellimonas sp. DF-77]|uniref:hypothetical protein n=1 Tax=Flagellimonas algarum TaxID=3230298 RepID=UPI003392E67B
MQFKHIISLIALVLTSGQVVSQSNPGNVGPSSYEVQLVPPNPEVADLGKFGAIPVNKYNGTANINIPIHTVSLDGLSIPLNLSYNTGGIRVNQEASWVGLGWNLATGIVITRQVNGFEDILDGLSSDHIGFLFTEDQYFPEQGMNGFNGNFELDPDELLDLSNKSVTVPDDLLPDLFTVNLPTGSYKFYLPKESGNGPDLEALVIGEQNIKVDFNMTTHNFVVTDSKGFEYHFDVQELSTSFPTEESSQATNDDNALLNHSGVAGLSRTDMISSWKVSQIRSPHSVGQSNGRILNFTYADQKQLGFPSFSETYSFQFNEPSLERTIGLPSRTYATLTGFNSKQLATISGDFGNIQFIAAAREDLYETADYQQDYNSALFNAFSNTNSDSRLARIEIRDFNGGLKKEVDLNHSYFNSNKLGQSDDSYYLRLKLDGVTIDGRTYAFEYINPNQLPAKDSKAIDFWGFYNGLDGNTHRIPSMNRFFVEFDLAQDQAFERFGKFTGVSRKSDFNYGKNGLLSRVVYPTKGATEFEYEANTVHLKNRTYTPIFDGSGNMLSSGITSSQGYDFCYQMLKLANDPNYSFDDNAFATCQDVSTNYTVSGSQFTVGPNTLCSGQSYNVKIQATLTHGSSFDESILPSGRAVWIKNLQTGQEIPVFDYDNQFNVNQLSVSLSKEFTDLPVGNYEFYHQPWSYSSQSVNAFAYVTSPSVMTFESLQLNPPPIVYEEFQVGGARVSKMINKGNNNEVITTKSFVYEQQEEGQTLSSGKLMDDLVFWSTTGSQFEYSPDIPATGAYSFYLSSDNKLRTMNSAAGSHIGYSKVTETSESTNGTANGKIVTEYVNKPNAYFKRNVGLSQINYGTISCGSWSNVYAIPDISCLQHIDVSYGETYMLEVLPNTFDYINGNIVEEHIYDSGNDLLVHTQNSFSERNIGFMPLPHYPLLIKVGQGLIVTEPYVDYADSDNGFKNVMRQDSSLTTQYFNGEALSTKTEATFEMDLGYLTRTNTVTSSDGKVMTTKYHYAEDLNITPLINANRLTEVVKTEQFEGTLTDIEQTLLASNETVFSNESNFSNLTLPKQVKSKKGANGPEEVRLVYDQYDNKGNVLQYHQEDGAYTSYIWGYNQQYPVAKIANATRAQVESALQVGSNYNTNVGGLTTDQVNVLRAIPGALVTTYTYDPLIGMTSMTDARGYTTFYEYDALNRIEFIKDAQGHLLQEYQYGYKNQSNPN